MKDSLSLPAIYGLLALQITDLKSLLLRSDYRKNYRVNFGVCNRDFFFVKRVSAAAAAWVTEKPTFTLLSLYFSTRPIRPHLSASVIGQLLSWFSDAVGVAYPPSLHRAVISCGHSTKLV